MSIPFLKGTIIFKTELSIEEVGRIISEKMFGGLPLNGLDKRIYDEVPAIYIDNEILGLRVILSGYSGLSEGEHYVLHIAPFGFSKKFGQVDLEEVQLNNYLNKLMEYHLGTDDRFTLNI